VDAPHPAVTAATLSDWLHAAVVAITVEREVQTPISALTFLTATYHPDAPANLPSRLVVKSPHQPVTERGVGEVHFYRDIAPQLGAPPLIRCLAAVQESAGAAEILVLEDLRATHDHPPWPLPPSGSQSELACDALARIHAHWWEAPALGRTVGQPHTTESLTAMVRGIARHLPAFIDALGDTLSAEQARVLERVFGSSLAPWLRLTDPRALTVAHGDAHTWNFLFPRAGSGPAFLIDWQLWHVDVGARDLAFFMALHWEPERRRELEQPLLRHYHRRLLECGVGQYSFDDLWLDYRRCAVRNLTIPILFWRRGMPAESWRGRLECAMASYDDLDCKELL